MRVADPADFCHPRKFWENLGFWRVKIGTLRIEKGEGNSVVRRSTPQGIACPSHVPALSRLEIVKNPAICSVKRDCPQCLYFF